MIESKQQSGVSGSFFVGVRFPFLFCCGGTGRVWKVSCGGGGGCLGEEIFLLYFIQRLWFAGGAWSKLSC